MRIGDRHGQQDVGFVYQSGKRFDAVDAPAIAVAHGASLNGSGVRANPRLGVRKRDPLVSTQYRERVALFLRRGGRAGRRSGDLSSVYIPSVEDEAIRDLGRIREGG